MQNVKGIIVVVHENNLNPASAHPTPDGLKLLFTGMSRVGGHQNGLDFEHANAVTRGVLQIPIIPAKCFPHDLMYLYTH